MSGRNTFEDNFKEDIFCGGFRNRVFSIMEDNKINGKELNWLIGAINITTPSAYYIQFQIDLKERVETKRDPYGFREANEIAVKHIRKCIAKCIGIGYSIIVEEKHGSEVCFDD